MYFPHCKKIYQRNKKKSFSNFIRFKLNLYYWIWKRIPVSIIFIEPWHVSCVTTMKMNQKVEISYSYWNTFIYMMYNVLFHCCQRERYWFYKFSVVKNDISATPSFIFELKCDFYIRQQCVSIKIYIGISVFCIENYKTLLPNVESYIWCCYLFDSKAIMSLWSVCIQQKGRIHISIIIRDGGRRDHACILHYNFTFQPSEKSLILVATASYYI